LQIKAFRQLTTSILQLAGSFLTALCGMDQEMPRSPRA
jgi:hypothetical protein